MTLFDIRYGDMRLTIDVEDARTVFRLGGMELDRQAVMGMLEAGLAVAKTKAPRKTLEGILAEEDFVRKSVKSILDACEPPPPA